MKNKIKFLIDMALEEADNKFSDFNSTHEGFSVLNEEFEESYDEIWKIKQLKEQLWENVKKDNYEKQKELNELIYETSFKLIEECLQLSAMSTKYQRIFYAEKSVG